MTLYDESGLEASNNILDIAVALNNISTTDILFSLIILALYIVSLVSWNHKNTALVMVVTSFMVSFVTALLFVNDLLGLLPLVVTIILFFISLVVKIWGDSE